MDSYEQRILAYANWGNAELKQFECFTPKGSKAFSVIRLKRLVDLVEVEQISIPPNTFVFSFRERGAIAVRHLSESCPLVATSGTIGFYTPGDYLTLSGLGEQQYILIVAHVLETSVISNYVDEAGLKFSVRRLTPIILDKIQQVSAQCEIDDGPNYLTVAGMFHLALDICLSEKQDASEGVIPDTIPDNFREICDRVAESPGENWSVGVAAAMAGLSQHYFSRTFKELYGDGFPGFVQTVRLNNALRLVSEGVIESTLIAHRSGFPSTNALREAFKSRLGFLPGDLRSLYAETPVSLNPRPKRLA